jgi:hypothetical protein
MINSSVVKALLLVVTLVSAELGMLFIVSNGIW